MPTVKERRSAYRKRKAEFAREHDNALETIRWHVTKALLEEFPTIEPQWLTVESNVGTLLEVRIQFGDYVVSYKVNRDHIYRPESLIPHAVSILGDALRNGPLREMFK